MILVSHLSFLVSGGLRLKIVVFLHGICPKPGILWIIGPLIKTNFVFGSVRTSTTATQPCGIINIGTFNVHELF